MERRLYQKVILGLASLAVVGMVGRNVVHTSRLQNTVPYPGNWEGEIEGQKVILDRKYGDRDHRRTYLNVKDSKSEDFLSATYVDEGNEGVLDYFNNLHQEMSGDFSVNEVVRDGWDIEVADQERYNNLLTKIAEVKSRKNEKAK
ncbi:hypothetical protein CMI38_00855 [Candidatus Pacearchaeota archaeon]|jgi:hypothetical protein|nr:hypothetical protein [Candidatus Pacearchaeota archaeon]|tara:strand:- start:149 stop:583 length:435 start_codon:yes stop_codon:yes gene_type:complete